MAACAGDVGVDYDDYAGNEGNEGNEGDEGEYEYYGSEGDEGNSGDEGSYDSSYEDLDTAADEFPPPDVDALEAMGYEALEGVGYLPDDDPQSVGRRLNGVVNVKVRCLS